MSGNGFNANASHELFSTRRVCATPTCVRPPELAVRIGWFAGGDDAPCRAILAHDHDFYGVQIVDGESVLAMQKTERAAECVATDADVGTLARGQHQAPSKKQPS